MGGRAAGSRPVSGSGSPPLALDDLRAGARLLRELPGFLRHPVGLPEARATVRRRLQTRGRDFLDLVTSAVYAHPASPYRALLAHAGCDRADLARLVETDGLEGALRALLRAGVYLTVDELKGRVPVRRGALTLAVSPASVRNPLARAHLPLRSGGHGGAALPMTVDLAFMRETNANHRCVLEARGAAGWTPAVWDVPGGAALIRVLRLAGIGTPPARWFSQIDPAAQGLHPRYRWAARALRWGSLAAGVPLPYPAHVPLSDPAPILRWMAEVGGRGATPYLVTTVSAGLRLAQHAGSAGQSLRGVQLTVSGEPITQARVAELRRSGADVAASYGSSDTGTAIAHSCLAPTRPDDMHLFSDLLAVVQPEDGSLPRGLPPGALLFTALRATAPLILLNAALGDVATLGGRTCGCALEREGWTTHLDTVRSFEKLTVGGMNLLDVDLIRVLDEILPARFGGGPTHYQLIEEQAAGGAPRLRLLVDPAVGPVDPAAVAEGFLDAIARGSGIERLTAATWREGGFVTVERRAPESRRGDKILHRLAGPVPGGDGGRPRGG